MKKYNYVSAILLLPVLYVPGVKAADNEISGFVMPTAKSVHVSGNEAKFSEYGDPDSSISGGAEVKASGKAGFVNFTAADIAQDTQNYKAEIGQYSKFKLDAFYNEIQHNNTFDAKSIESGVGTNQLSSPLSARRFANAPDPASVGTTFDYAISRDQYGAGIRLDLLKPFFANLSVSQENRDGIRPIGAGASSFAAELPEPVDYKTNIMQAEVGYGQGPFFASLGYTGSKFENAYDTLYFTNLYAAAGSQSDLVSLPPDNSYDKFDLKGRVKLPLKSALAFAYGQSKAESDANMYSAYNVTSTTTPFATTAHALTQADNVFNGRVDTKNYSAAFTTNPVNMIDGKVFYRNYATYNKSDEIAVLDNGSTVNNPLFDYTKKSYGVEVGVKLPGHVTLTPAYTKVAKVLPAGIRNDDKIYSIGAEWKGLEILAANIGYERMDRDDHVDSSDTGFGSANALISAPYTRQFDIAAQKRDTVKLGLDVSPSEKLELGFAFKHKNVDYNETTIGFTGQRNSAYGVSVNFAPIAMVSISAYADYELVKLEKLQRQGATAALNNASPEDTNSADAAYNVTTSQKDKSLDWGLGLDVIAIPKKLALRAQYDHTRSDGNADFTYASNSVANNAIPSGWTNDTIDYSSWDDYKKDSLLLKATFSVSASLDLIGGYAYEYYRYSDGQYDGYKYLYNTSATQPGYLSGANADQDYTANVVWMSAKYKF